MTHLLHLTSYYGLLKGVTVWLARPARVSGSHLAAGTMSPTESSVKQAYRNGWSVFPDDIEQHIFLLAVSTTSESGLSHYHRYLLVAKRVCYW